MLTGRGSRCAGARGSGGCGCCSRRGAGTLKFFLLLSCYKSTNTDAAAHAHFVLKRSRGRERRAGAHAPARAAPRLLYWYKSTNTDAVGRVAKTLGGKEREAQAVRPQLQRLQTLFHFRSVEAGGRRPTGGGGGGGGGLVGSCGEKVVAMRWLSCSRIC
jgi:hypothetical protein